MCLTEKSASECDLSITQLLACAAAVPVSAPTPNVSTAASTHTVRIILCIVFS
jgi:hypothetical protein